MAAEQPSSSSCADFKFNPPEERLILEYLRPFALGRITGAESVINDDPYRTEPWELLAEHQRDVEESAFFFARKTMVGTRRSRTVRGNGTWRTQISEKRAVDDGGGGVVAVFRKTLLSYYYLGGNQIMSTGYVMYEYELYVDSHGRGGGSDTYDSMLCHVKKSCREVARSNKRKRKREFQATTTTSGIMCNPYPYPHPHPYPYPYSAAAAAGSSSSSSLPGCRSLCPCEAPVVSRSPELKAILEPPTEATTNITSTDLSQTISQPTFGSKDAAFLVLLPSEPSSDDAPSENKPRQEEEEPPPSDSCNKSETPYSVGELIDILVTSDPAKCNQDIRSSVRTQTCALPYHCNRIIEQLKRRRLRLDQDEAAN